MVTTQNDEAARPARQRRLHLSIVTSLTLRVFYLEFARLRVATLEATTLLISSGFAGFKR
jgi:hypothetical protein